MMESEDGMKPFNCSICPLAFASKGNLSRHIKIKHEVSKQTTTKFKCEICSARFNLKSDLKKHIASLHERKKRPDVSKGGIMSEDIGEFLHLPKNVPRNYFKLSYQVHDIDKTSILFFFF